MITGSFVSSDLTVIINIHIRISLVSSRVFRTSSILSYSTLQLVLLNDDIVHSSRFFVLINSAKIF